MRSTAFGVFMTFALLIITAAHFLVYWSINYFFPNLIDPISRRWLFAIFLLLSSGFVIASVAVHLYENIFTRALYLTAASWLGIFSNLFIATIGLLLFYGLTSIFDYDILVHNLIAAVFYFGAIGISLYGFWNVQHVRVKNFDIVIERLPKAWEGKKIAQLSDVHLGVVHREDFLQYLIDKINKQNVDMVVITGDFFDGMDGRLEHLASPLNRLKAPKGIYYITGNHETYLGTDKTNAALAKETNITHLNNINVNVDGLNILGIDYPDRGEKFSLLDTINKLATTGPTVLLYHEPKNIEGIAKLNKIDLVLSGHTHQGQIWPYNYIAAAVYGKFVYGINVLGRLTSYTSTGAGTWGPPMRTGNTPEIPIFTLRNK